MYVRLLVTVLGANLWRRSAERVWSEAPARVRRTISYRLYPVRQL